MKGITCWNTDCKFWETKSELPSALKEGWCTRTKVNINEGGWCTSGQEKPQAAEQEGEE
jgi:hypothetical protein